MGFKAPEDQKVSEEQKEQEEMMVHRAKMEILALKENAEMMASLEHLVKRDKRDHKVHRAQ